MSRPTPRIALLLILLIAFGLRLHRLGYQELRGDEAFGYFFSQRSFAGIVQATLELQEPHPVASYFVQKAWLAAAGDREVALRYLSAWFGVAAVALIARLGRRLDYAPAAAVSAAGLLAISPYTIWHSQDARMYSMSLALTLASTWLAVEWLGRQRWPWAAGYVAVSWLALHTHYFAAFVLLAQSAFVLSRALVLPRLYRTAISWLSLQLVLGMLYLPWLTQAGATLAGYLGNGDSPAFLAMLQRAGAVLAVGESMPPAQRPWWALASGIALVTGGLWLARAGPAARRSLWLLALYLGVPLLATWVSARQRPIFDERYLVAAAPPFYLLLAANTGWIDAVRSVHGRPRAAARAWALATALLFAIVVAGMLLSLAGLYANPAYSKTRGWRELAAAFDRLAAGLPAEQVRVAQNYPDPTLWYYYRGPIDHTVLPPAPHDAAGAAQAASALAEAGVARVILPVQPAKNWDASGIAPAALGAVYDQVVEKQVGVWPVQVYAGQPLSATVLPLEVRFDNGVTLAGVGGLAETALPPGGMLAPKLFWTTGQKAMADVKVTVQLLDDQGRLVAQHDEALAAARPGNGMARVRSYGILLPEALAPGEYRLIVALYDGAQAKGARFLTEDGADAVELARVAVLGSGGEHDSRGQAGDR